MYFVKTVLTAGGEEPGAEQGGAEGKQEGPQMHGWEGVEESR